MNINKLKIALEHINNIKTSNELFGFGKKKEEPKEDEEQEIPSESTTQIIEEGKSRLFRKKALLKQVTTELDKLLRSDKYKLFKELPDIFDTKINTKYFKNFFDDDFEREVTVWAYSYRNRKKECDEDLYIDCLNLAGSLYEDLKKSVKHQDIYLSEMFDHKDGYIFMTYNNSKHKEKFKNSKG